MVSIKDVAAEAGVSIATVSNVINQSRKVSEPLRKKVMAAVDRLGYQVDPLASNMRREHTHTIGLITTKIASVFYPYVIDGINKVTREHKYDLILFNTESDRDSEKASIRRLVQTRVSGIILDTSFAKDDETYFLSLTGLSYRGYKIPVVSIELDLSRYGIDSVFVDNVEGGYLATRHLIDQNCRRIAHILGTPESSLSQDRLLGYKRALMSAGLPVDENLIVPGNFSQVSGYQAVRQLLDLGLPVDGIFAANDQMAAGACVALREKKIRIPADVRLVGFDNTFIASIVTPSISTINVPKFDMGYQAAQNLIKRIEAVSNGSQLPASVKLPIDLVVRQTTNPNAEPDLGHFDW